MSKLIIQAIDAYNNFLFDGEFDGDAFFEGVFVQVSDELGLTKPTEEMLANTKEGLTLRRARRLSFSEKCDVFDELIGKSLPDKDNARYDNKVACVLAICNERKCKTYYDRAEKGQLTAKDIIDCFKGLKYGNIEDINELFEENKKLIPRISSLDFMKKED